MSNNSGWHDQQECAHFVGLRSVLGSGLSWSPPGRAWRAAYPSWSEAATVPRRRKSNLKTGKIWQVEPSHWPCGLAAFFFFGVETVLCCSRFSKSGDSSVDGPSPCLNFPVLWSNQVDGWEFAIDATTCCNPYFLYSCRRPSLAPLLLLLQLLYRRRC